MAWTASQISDLALGTLHRMPVPKFTQIAQNLTRYVIFNQWFLQHKIAVRNGKSLVEDLMVNTGNAAKVTGLYGTSAPKVEDHMTEMEAPWAHLETSWTWDRRELAMNAGPAIKFKVIEPRELGAMISLVELIENLGWEAPTVAQSDHPYGVAFWVVKNATAGFNGALPQDHTTLAGVNLTTYPQFKNWTDTFDERTKDQMVLKMRTARTRTNFLSPLAAPPKMREKVSSQFLIYCNNNVNQSFELIAEQQNENLGVDIYKYRGAVVFNGTPVIYVPQLDADTDNPIYMCNHTHFKVYGLQGEWLVRTGPLTGPHQPTVKSVYIHISFQILCNNRREQAVLYEV